MNPNDMIDPKILEQLKSVNPKETAKKLANQSNNPMFKNLVTMMEQGNQAGVNEFAKNIFAQKGINFNQFFTDFINKIK